MYNYYNVLQITQILHLAYGWAMFIEACDLGMSGLAVGMLNFQLCYHVSNGIIKK